MTNTVVLPNLGVLLEHLYGRGNRQNIETDEVEILTGVRFGATLGSPISLLLGRFGFAGGADTCSEQ